MVSRTATTTLILLTLVVMAAPAMADDSESPPEPVPSEFRVPSGPCNILNIQTTYPFADFHPECL
ncbi:MAG: hypothetical protein WC876_02350 [Candidatus Thermoplasmatota archaeon]